MAPIFTGDFLKTKQIIPERSPIKYGDGGGGLSVRFLPMTIISTQIKQSRKNKNLHFNISLSKDVNCCVWLQGVCMFAWNCVEAGGKHLGTCIDR